jgi:hypothetical protein
MKKSEMTVSMPLPAFNEYEDIRSKYENLKKELSECFDSTLYDQGGSTAIDFSVNKALSVCKRFLPYRHEGADVDIRM